MNAIQLIQTTNNFVIKLIWQNFFLAASRIYHQMAKGFPDEMCFSYYTLQYGLSII
jgi:hypothetical protein